MSNVLKMLSRGGAAAAETDPNFKQTVLLLHGDGTNGAQNNTFLDGSTNNFTITRNGNTTQGTFSPFSLAAGEWSNYFDGTGDYLSLANNSAFDITSGNFCAEMWLYKTVSGVSEEMLWSQRTATPVTGGWECRLTSANLVQFFFVGGSIITSASAIPINTWTHLAVTRDSNTVRLFINGVVDATATFANGTSITSSLFIGYGTTGGSYFTGYISNARLVKGSSVYTSAFTPPTAPLTNITNTSLLTCQSNRFVDNSTNAFTITRNGDVRVTPFSPFAPTAAYSAGTNGGSGYLDGNGDYLTLPSNSALTLNGDFTVEFWVYLQSLATSQTFWSGSAPTIEYNSPSGNWIFYNGSTTRTCGAAVAGNWQHVALSRTGSTLECYVNGTRGSSSTDTTTLDFSGGSLGYRTLAPSGGNITGYLSSIRFIKGTGIYTGTTLTVPTAPLTAITNTSLLLNFTNAGIIDNTGKNNLETVGNAQIDTTTKKYGTGSLEFDGTGDWLLVPNSPDNQLGTGNFTIELWVYLSAINTAEGFVAKGGASTGWLLSMTSSNTVRFTYTSSTITSTGTLAINTWYHIAVVREGTGTNQTKIYINGVNDGTGTVATDFNQTEVMYIGANRTGGDPLNGFIDDLRITKGVARYTANFTAPTKEFPDL